MRLPLLLAFGALALSAQVPAAKWTFGMHSTSPTLEGDFQGTVDGEAINFDLKQDLRLAKDKAKPGALLEYQGHRFGLTLSADAQDYAGSAMLSRPVTLGGTTYTVNTKVDSWVKVKTYDLNWTIRALTWEHAWIGVDLGLHGWDLDLSATGVEQSSGQTRPAAEKIAVPIPQLGLSVGGKAFGDRFVGRASYHLLTYKGATYHRWQGDIRYFPLSWLGVRVFLDDQSFDVPQGSVKDDLVFNLKRSGAGFGVVLRF